ncbi:chromosome segregation protein SMC [Hathewaya limosa]|uniref:Chromosome partition protein Smc n=1 Tax=Hathewaya limosa TaxID=1536 RepID=A0ABU0JRF8_HATLI|nr:chromosome segregation protein SMC [Hathewaya limosa]MDQ0479020.1 chromosome segregation protein [Hathewaya limosa]
MFLKSIEIRGFKSFADKTELNFKKGITSVVGPNGSGKSNVSDAVRWVLGEQSVKSLRGAKMEDVIFAGTEFRKPVGLSQVSLVLNNDDHDLNVEYSDVKITRRLYRSGESEYFINNTKCRLKDIQELFMDTGIGKEGYSIIGQGKIDAILSGRPEERRSLLEEAAGIVKFKTRKQEAERKLESTEQNLIRIMDILNTYGERLEPLKSEMEKAKEFLTLSTELKNKDLALTIDIIERIHDRIKLVNNDNISKEKILKTYSHKKQRLKEILEQYNKTLEEYEIANKENREEYYNSKEKINNIQNQIKLIEEKIKSLNIFLESFSEEKKRNEEELNNLSLKKEILEKEIQEINKEFLIYEESIHKGNESLEKLQKSIEEDSLKTSELKQKLKVLNENENKKQQEVENLKRELKALEEKIEDIKFNFENTLNIIKINNNTRLELENQCEILKNKISQLENTLKENLKNIGILRTKVRNEENKQKSININLSKEEAQYNLLLNLEKQHEGYTKAVKNLMDHINKNFIKDVKESYVLGEIINVPEKYEKAIEIALGAAISNVITENENEAKILIEYLKEKNLGRATFLPLNIIRSKNLSVFESIKSMNGFMGVASSLIHYPLKFKKAIEFVLGNVIIAENMDCALKIAKRINYSNRIVTLSGEVLNVGGSLTGGSTYSKSSNVISRKREIKDTEEKINTIKQQLNDITKLIEQHTKNISFLDEETLNLRDTIHGENIDLVKLKEKINSLKDEEIRCNNSIKTLKENLSDGTSKIKFFKGQKELLIKEIEEFDKEKNDLNTSIQNIESGLQDFIFKIEAQKEILVNYKIELAKVNEKVENKNNLLSNLDIAIQDKLNNIKEFEHKQKENIEAIKVYKEKIENFKMDLETLNKEIFSLEDRFNLKEQERITLKEQVKKVNSDFEQVLMEEEKVEKDVNKIVVNLTKLETEKQGIIDRLNEEYDITYAEALDYKEENLDHTDLKKTISLLKEKISSLGIVNVGAIEEYKELKEKYTFMSEQKIDLENSREEVIKVIEEMTLKMKEVFRENFEKLNEYFHETFRELFKGGSASLILSEGDELDGKIDINVQPPGKKLQNINLMSGGEKGLSAIALLFSILKMKPTPFCILDEIEAALDDANVKRYADFLKKFSDKIQFIVITHRKGTMEVSDALYGITMEEKGISKVVSVDLNKHKND